MKKLLLVALFAMTACGVAGEPERPKPGVTITGEASAGVKGTL